MRDRTKGFITGFLATCLVLSSAGTALAATGSVLFNSVNIKNNGEVISNKGENFTISSGASVPSSILYTDENGGGTTYLPIARIGKLLGTEIGWDGKTSSVLIGESSPVTTPQTPDAAPITPLPVTPTIPDTPIRIYEVSEPDTDSAGGVSFTIYWNNHKEKPIKYIHFFVTPYNRVGDVQTCNIRRYSTHECYSTGPFNRVTSDTDWRADYYFIPIKNYSISLNNPYDDYSLVLNGRYYSGKHTTYNDVTSADYDKIFFEHSWDCVWYNYDISKIVIDKVYIEYMDGSTATLTGSNLSKCMY